MSVMIVWILLIYPFLMKLMPSILLAKMPLLDDAYEDELAIVPYVKHEIVAIAPTLDCPIILLKSPTHITENCALIKAQCDGMHLSYVPKDRVENYTRVLAGHEQHALCDSYILDVVHDATENYFERGKPGCRNF